MEYANSIPAVRDILDRDEIIELVKDEFEDFLTVEILDELNSLKLPEKSQIKVKSVKNTE
jgi:hypothetical protein